MASVPQVRRRNVHQRGEVMLYHRVHRGISLSANSCDGARPVRHADTTEGGDAMDGATLGMAMAAVAAVALIWWGLHSSPVDADFIDHQADKAFRARTQRKSLSA
jgi:hypothetical protein